jgi:hypothetical protein
MDTTKITDTDIRVIRKASCSSLSGRSELKFEYGYNNKSKTIMYRIVENTGAGHFCDHWVQIDAILKCLQETKEPFSLRVLKSIYVGQSINNTGFIGAVLIHEGLIICEKRQYLKKDTKTFLADLNKLVKPTPKKKSATKKQPAKA